MEQYTTTKGIWNGWYWRFVGLTVLGVSLLEIIAKYTIHYPLYQSLTLAVLIVSYVTIPRVRERRLANAFAGVIATFVIGIILQLLLGISLLNAEVLYLDLLGLVLGVVMSAFYLWITQWSEKKRGQLEERRRQKNASTTSAAPVRRHHSTKKGKKKGKKR